jgi:hypothetical protein
MVGWGHLMPGEKGAITVKVDTRSRKGPVADTVEVSCNDPARLRITLTLKAFVVEDSR